MRQELFSFFFYKCRMHLWVIELGMAVEKWFPSILVAPCWDLKSNKSKHSKASEANLSGHAGAAYICVGLSLCLAWVSHGEARNSKIHFVYSGHSWWWLEKDQKRYMAVLRHCLMSWWNLWFVHECAAVCWEGLITNHLLEWEFPIVGLDSPIIFEPRHEKFCLSHMRTTKAQISLHIRTVRSAPLLFAAWIV